MPSFLTRDKHLNGLIFSGKREGRKLGATTENVNILDVITFYNNFNKVKWQVLKRFYHYTPGDMLKGRHKDFIPDASSFMDALREYCSCYNGEYETSWSDSQVTSWSESLRSSNPSFVEWVGIPMWSRWKVQLLNQM